MGDHSAIENLISLLRTCRQKKDSGLARQWLAYIRQRHLDTHTLLGNFLVPVLVDCGCLSEAQQVFDRLPTHNEYSWTSLIFGYSVHGDHEHAFQLYHRMQKDHIQPNSYTYVRLLQICTSLECVERGSQIHTDIVITGWEHQITVSNTLVGMYAKCGLLTEARDVFAQMSDRDAVSWTALISGYTEQGLGEDALSCFKDMQLNGIPADDLTFVCSLKACGIIGDAERGLQLCGEIAEKGLERDLFVGCTMVDMYAKCGLLAEAQKMFNKLPVRNVITWTALIAGYAENGCGDEALNCFKKMQQDEVSPVAVTLACCLKACGIIGVLEAGQEIHAEITKRGWDGESLVASTLVDMYGKCGLLADGREVFDRLPDKTVASWSAMIGGYGENHNGEMAVQVFEKMQEQGVKPNAITFSCLLAACSHSSLLDEGQKYYTLMTKHYNIEPTLDHYTCMVDLLARAGHVYGAVKFLEGMNCPPSAGMLRSVLTACKRYGEVELGLSYFQQLVQMKQDDAAVYLLMADTYASAGKWNDAKRLEEIRMLAKANKKLAGASFEANQKFNEFIVGDKPNKYMLSMLESLRPHVRTEGHVPDLDLIFAHVPKKDKEVTSHELIEIFPSSSSGQRGNIAIKTVQ